MPDTTHHDGLHDRRASDRREAKLALKKKAKKKSWLIVAGYGLLVLGNAAGIAKSYDVAQDNHTDSDKKQAAIAQLALQAKYDASFQEYATCVRGNDFRDVISTAISKSLRTALQTSIPPGTDPVEARVGIKKVQESVDRQLQTVTNTKRQCAEPPAEPGVTPRVLKASDFGSKGMNKR